MQSATKHTRAPSGAQWTIEAAGHRAVIVEVGGGVRSYSGPAGDVLDGYAEHEMCPASAGKVLAPWPNRIRDGRYTVDDEPHQLALTEPSRHNASHGLVHWVRWHPVEQAADRVTVAHELVPQPGYPWPLILRTTWSVSADGLRAAHEVTNAGERAAPFGLGLHPYVLIPGVPIDELVIRMPARSRLLVDSRMLPMGIDRVGGEYDFTEGRRLGPTALDTAFGELDREPDGGSTVTLRAPDGRGVTAWADAGFHWWQLFTGDTLGGGRRRRSVALEPMTCPPDAFRSGRDLIRLEAGQTWSGSWGIRPW